MCRPRIENRNARAGGALLRCEFVSSGPLPIGRRPTLLGRSGQPFGGFGGFGLIEPALANSGAAASVRIAGAT